MVSITVFSFLLGEPILFSTKLTTWANSRNENQNDNPFYCYSKITEYERTSRPSGSCSPFQSLYLWFQKWNCYSRFRQNTDLFTKRLSFYRISHSSKRPFLLCKYQFVIRWDNGTNGDENRLYQWFSMEDRGFFDQLFKSEKNPFEKKCDQFRVEPTTRLCSYYGCR